MQKNFFGLALGSRKETRASRLFDDAIGAGYYKETFWINISAAANVRMGIVKLFFSDYCEDKVLESRDARVATMPEILHSMDCVLHVPGNFLGLIDAMGVVIQFMVNEDGTIHIDLPMPVEGGSYVKKTDLPECLAIVGRLGDSFHIGEIPKLSFQRW